ncbi:MAG: divergent PAP2 family protein [Candidatus Omnitrophica bacterium]|nr:divergent PAP2 family protein [Candidatus Omnitrophota bacterium]
MRNLLAGLAHNQVFLTTFFAWLLAQGIKVVKGVWRERRFDFRWFLDAGGMPSAHTATVTALSTAVGLTQGFESPLFAITFFFTVIVLFDAAGFRRAAGRQASTLNRIMDDIYLGRGVPEERLRELLGHTPVEVIAGGIVGIGMGLIFHA